MQYFPCCVSRREHHVHVCTHTHGKYCYKSALQYSSCLHAKHGKYSEKRTVDILVEIKTTWTCHNERLLHTHARTHACTHM